MSKENYVPLHEASSERIITNITLPFGIEKQLGMNMKKVERLCQIGGIRTLRLQNEKDPKLTDISMQIVGVNEQGGAIAGAGKSLKVSTYSTKYEPVDKFLKFKESSWINLVVSINDKELKRRILEEGLKVNQADIWAYHVNTNLKRGIISNGLKHLTSMPLLGDKMDFFFSIYVLQSIFKDAINIASPNVARTLALETIGYLLIFKVSRALVQGHEKPGKGARYSLFMGAEIDRVLLLALASLGKPLIKKLE